MNYPPALAGCALALLACHSAGAVNVRLESSATWVENITRSVNPLDWNDTMRYDTRVAVGLLREWQTGFITSGEFDASYERVPQFSRQSAVTAGATGTIRQKFGLGAFAPSLSLDLGLHGRDAKVDAGDGWIAAAGLRLAKRITESWRVGAVGDWKQQYARKAFFNSKHQRLFGTLTWDIAPWLQLSHGNGRLWGTFIGNTSPRVSSAGISGARGPIVADFYKMSPWGVTDSFGPGWITILVRGREVKFWWLELSPALGRNTSLPLRYESVLAVNKIGGQYRQDLWTVQVLHRF